MTDRDLTLVVAGYPDADSAGSGLDALNAAAAAQRFDVRGAVVVSRDADGKVDIAHRETEMVGGGAALGGAAGLVVGLFAPPFFLAGLVGAGIGALAGHLAGRQHEQELDDDLEESLPAGSSAVVALVAADDAGRVEAALTGAVKTLRRPVDPDDVVALEKALGGATHEAD